MEFTKSVEDHWECITVKLSKAQQIYFEFKLKSMCSDIQNRLKARFSEDSFSIKIGNEDANKNTLSYINLVYNKYRFNILFEV